MIKFNFTGNYNEEFNAYINDLFTYTKKGEYGLGEREVRMSVVNDLIESYIEIAGERPKVGQLDRLSTLILNEELTDKDRMKSRNNEYPLLSDDQLKRREEEELSLRWADEVATDGRDRRPKTRDNNRKMREISGLY